MLTVGLLGAAGMLLTSVRNSHNSYLRSQASLIADSLLERMRANPAGVSAGLYEATLDSDTPEGPDCASGCGFAQIAERDRGATAAQIVELLPAGQATVECDLAAVIAGSRGIPPVAGSCTITMSWDEKRDVDAGGMLGNQTFEVVVQP
ncbi:MAG: hypothetical protein HYV17_13885 [Xanthomonadales bacterium]|nr:hypothetical protein [Xanthomonadales bacterium]